MGQTIEDLLKSMLTVAPESKKGDFIGKLENTYDTWRRIGEQDDFAELNFASDQERKAFLQEWIENNPYSNI